MNDTSQRPPLPDRLSVDPRSPNHMAAVFEHAIGIRLNGKVPSGKTLDRKGRPLLIKLKGKVEAFYR